MIAISDRASKIHFIGIGGSGMSGLARLALEAGYRVTGSDLKAGDSTAGLEALGARVYRGHHVSYLEADTDLVVYSSAVKPDNPELLEAGRRGLEVISRGEFLARFMEGYRGIAVAGTHGKTTTTAMIATVLKQAGLDPTVVVGGRLVSEGTNAWLGRGEFMVAEADESDGSFLRLRPALAVVTNVEDDHLDHYGRPEALREAFRRFLAQVDSRGRAVVCADDPVLMALASEQSQVITYGLGGEAFYRAETVELNALGSRSRVYEGGRHLGVLELAVPGRHNVSNALAAVAVTRTLGLSFEVAARALADYAGVARRFQLLGEAAGRLVVDDYAHHPTEIRTTLEAARRLGRRVVAVFQPHRYTRTGRLFREFASALMPADLVILTDVYGAGETPLPGVHGGLIAEEFRRRQGPPVYYCPERHRLAGLVEELTRPGDLVLTLGAGDITDLGRQLLARWSGAEEERRV
ncbi:MAG: UDP-N-acetylmuramate--L-alanine ligase [Clostridia bacterium]|jgi:UDP-N-acetylmuramate--alanine ligase|nr:UDP-N-acetylmuramate--L-alanine ligase [Clostridia bacterium]MDH7573301.1 UDP-N-acetylmuramate--L-alanine ligase [Clostridia bacterium]